jgi:Tfp pilus assembly protein PilN
MIGFVAVVSLVTFARGLPALRSWENEQSSAATSAARELALFRGGLRALPEIRDTLRARHRRLLVVDSTLLHGASPSAIAAALASVLEDVAEDNAIKITALQLRADSVAIAGLSHVAVRLTGVSDVIGLVGFLRDVEGSAIPLVVRDLSVSQPEPAAPDSKPEALRIDVLVAGIGSLTSYPPR